MARITLFVFLLYALVALSIQRSTVDSPSYVAAVLEYSRDRNFTRDAENYLRYVKEAANKSADIIVFPEMTIRSTEPFEVPNPVDKVKLCGNTNSSYQDFLVQLSCAAYRNSIYVVINLEEKLDCTNKQDDVCQEEKIYLFNTNVVFDRDGVVIDVYRKINLFLEGNRTPSLDRKLGVFQTDFGVKFGHFICFDILFQTPAVDVLEKEAVRDVIFPTMWFSEMPFLTGVQTQEGYAYAYDLNLLAAGANQPRVGSTGSGIYSGKAGALVSVMSGVSESRLLIATVPKAAGSVAAKDDAEGHIRPNNLAEMDDLVLLQDRVTVYNSQIIEETEMSQFINLSYGNADCTFEVKLSKIDNKDNKNHSAKNYTYRAIAFNGVQRKGDVNMGEVECAIIACTNKELSSCGKRFPAGVEVSPSYSFSRISVVALIPSLLSRKYHGVVFRPSTLMSTLSPLSPKQYHFRTHVVLDSSGMSQTVLTSSNVSLSNFYTFGLYARDYANDHKPLTPNSATGLGGMFVQIVAAIFLGQMFIPYCYII